MTTLTTKISILTIILALTLGTKEIEKKDPVKIDTKELSLIKKLDLEFEEEAPIIEDWMFEELELPEEEPMLEDWMFDTEYFDEDILIEDWMLDTEYYSY